MDIVKGYKATDKDMKCRGFQFELGPYGAEGRKMKKLTGFAIGALIVVTYCFAFWAFFLWIMAKAFVR